MFTWTDNLVKEYIKYLSEIKELLLPSLYLPNDQLCQFKESQSIRIESEGIKRVYCGEGEEPKSLNKFEIYSYQHEGNIYVNANLGFLNLRGPNNTRYYLPDIYHKTIHSVKRLSDNHLFIIGDIVKCPVVKKTCLGYIVGFNICDNKEDMTIDIYTRYRKSVKSVPIAKITC